MDRSDAEELDRADPLAPFRHRFDGVDDGPIYMDGNSLGRPPCDVRNALASGFDEWQADLVGAWTGWIDLPVRVGDRLGRLTGAAPGQLVACDSTTVNLYKLAAAAMGADPGRRDVVADAADFPTDRYVLAGLCQATGGRLTLVDTEAAPDPVAAVAKAVGPATALVVLSQVNYRSGARLDAPAVTDAVHRGGALVLWDLCHSAGAVPVDLDGWGADLAVGCTYKYLNSGPGAPGFAYVRAALQERLRQPIWGWFGAADQFAMGPDYRPAPGAASVLTGTPGILALMAVDAAAAVTEEAGVAALWRKSQALTALLVERVGARLVPLGARLVTPADPARRGAHVSVAHPRAWPWCRSLIDRGLVVGDFRAPDVIRIGPAPLYTRFVDAWDAVERMADVLGAGVEGDPADRPRVT